MGRYSIHMELIYRTPRTDGLGQMIRQRSQRIWVQDEQNMDIRNTQYQSVYLNFNQQFKKGEDRIKRVAR
jgi:hypothetical protein